RARGALARRDRTVGPAPRRGLGTGLAGEVRRRGTLAPELGPGRRAANLARGRTLFGPSLRAARARRGRYRLGGIARAGSSRPDRSSQPQVSPLSQQGDRGAAL